jgi:hypothetical protein
MKLSVKTFAVIGERPKIVECDPRNELNGLPIPETWFLFKAPRPLDGSITFTASGKMTSYGMAWESLNPNQGHRGYFFGAVNPQRDPRISFDSPERCVRENFHSDAWVAVFVDEATVMDWGKNFCENERIPWEEVDPRDVRQEYLDKHFGLEITIEVG